MLHQVGVSFDIIDYSVVSHEMKLQCQCDTGHSVRTVCVVLILGCEVEEDKMLSPTCSRNVTKLRVPYESTKQNMWFSSYSELDNNWKCFSGALHIKLKVSLK